MEVLGSPSISRAPMGGAMLSEYRKLVYADGRYNDNTLSCAYLKFILLLQDFFLSFLTVCAFLSLFLFGLVFLFCESTHYEKQGKKINKNDNNLRTGRSNTLLCRSFYRLSRGKRVKKGKRKVQGVPQSQTAAFPRPQEEEDTDKS